MSTNLVNNYISAYKQPKQDARIGNPHSKPIPGLKPVNPEGELRKYSLIEPARNISYNTKALAKGISGKSNDHQLGKINDLGLKLGGLAIAGLLLTQKQTAKAKLMELVGFTTFFASMPLWPKIALHLPAKVIHGFNPGQKYQDSQGRKKPFFQDPQYLPWDLYNDKQINKIGDRLNVPEDLPNRREFIQEKMKKIAIQNNTMWMLTAGFAAPIMSALICNVAEKPIENQLNKLNIKKAKDLLDDLNSGDVSRIEKYVKGINYEESKTKLSSIIESNKNKPLTPELIDKISENLAPGIFEVKRHVKNDLLNVLDDGSKLIDEDALKEAYEAAFNVPGFKMDRNTVSNHMPPFEDVLNLIKNNNHLGTPLNQEAVRTSAEEISDLIGFALEDNNLFKNQDIADDYALKLFTNIKKIFDSKSANTLNDANISKINNISNELINFSKRSNALNEYYRITVAETPESVLAHTWNSVTADFDKLFGFSSDEIKKVHFDRLDTQELLRSKIEHIASSADDNQYKKVIAKLSQKLKKLEEVTNPQEFHKLADTVYDSAAGALYNLGLKKTATDLTQYNELQGNCSLKNLAKKALEERLAGAQNSFKRWIGTLDIYRRISQGDFGQTLNQNMSQEIVEEGLEAAKQVSLQGHASDYYNKFFILRNPDSTPKTGHPKVVNGKIINEFFGKTKGVEMGYDHEFFRNVMRFMHENDMDKVTKDALGEEMLKKIASYRKEFLNKMGNAENKVKPFHMLDESAHKYAVPIEGFNLTGLALDEMMHNLFKQKFNSGKWLKIFGKSAIALTGVTVLSQFFFGKMKNPKKVQGEIA